MWLSLSFMVLAGIANAAMDSLKTKKWSTSIFRKLKMDGWFNPAISWKNKWKSGDSMLGERFFGASTFLVWLTDAWHFFKMLMLTSICMAIVLYTPLINWYVDSIILLLAFTLPFELFYSKIFNRNDFNLCI